MEVSELWFLGKLSITLLILIAGQVVDPWMLIRESRFVEARRIIKESLITAQTKNLPELYYLSAIVSDDPKLAIQYLNKAAKSPSHDRYFYLANLELAKVDYVYGDYNLTVSRLKRIAPLCKDLDLKDQILFWLGLAQLEVSSKKGVKTLTNLMKTFPDSRWSARAQAIIGVSNRHYSIQTGAFKTQRNALRQKEKIMGFGFDVHIIEKKIGDETFYRVLVGGFRNLEDGLRLVDSLKVLGVSEARVVGY